MWIYPQTMQVFKLHSDIRAAFHGTSFPSVMTDEDLAALGVYPVKQTASGHNPITQTATEASPALIAGEWSQQWEVVQKYATPEEEAAAIAADQEAKAKALQESIVSATQKRLDDFARTRNYDGILSLCTYATSAVPKFAAEGQYGVNARDATWAKLYSIMGEVQAGTRPAPVGFADIEPELPVLEWLL